MVLFNLVILSLEIDGEAGSVGSLQDHPIAMSGVARSAVEAGLEDLAQLGLDTDPVRLQDLTLCLVPEAAKAYPPTVVDFDDEGGS